VFVCEGLVGESVVAVCEFDELDCDFGGGCYGCLYLVWGPNYACDIRAKFGLTLARSLYACAGNKPLWGCLFGRCVILVWPALVSV
jgi:hypothetical protein